MITDLEVINFKKFERIEVELGQNVVFIGPNNSGKTTALQALSLWDIGLKKWLEKKSSAGTKEKRIGVAINRRDLTAIPIPAAKLLWKDQHVREGGGNIRIYVVVSGVSGGKKWVITPPRSIRPLRESLIYYYDNRAPSLNIWKWLHPGYRRSDCESWRCGVQTHSDRHG